MSWPVGSRQRVSPALPLRRGSPEHRAYMRSQKWESLKYTRLVYQNWQCDTCDMASFDVRDFQLHHRTYVRLGMEGIDDVRGLCASCHERLSRKGKRR